MSDINISELIIGDNTYNLGDIQIPLIKGDKRRQRR